MILIKAFVHLYLNHEAVDLTRFKLEPLLLLPVQVKTTMSWSLDGLELLWALVVAKKM
ncbi:hypothetical protein Osc7112_2207 [Oscillatoria nigro-viridis PCC 7112]|uniref:Uncharacterized protein n=1 Tax=Phormidium nigroviride PCC 7112 TaxID=179408 RepID=K9VGM8_9CYAN|nr:hypothetical protein Osc7112_2207 [Oscillatoria nigro-viridis PCC 7112]